jgi:mRNA (guanine-N7-)-methyltransferase
MINTKEIIKNYKKGVEFEIVAMNTDFFHLFLDHAPPNLTPEETVEYKISDNEKYIEYKNKITLKKKTGLFVEHYDDVYFTIRNEEEKEVKSLKKSDFPVRYRKRYFFKKEEYPNWRFDLSENIIDEKKSYHIEAEFIETKPTEKEINDIFLLFKKYMILYDLQTILKKNNDNMRSFLNRPIDITLKEINKIKKGYAVSEKADGERCILHYNRRKNVYAVFQPFEIKYVGTHNLKLFKSSVLDCEYSDKYYVFDMLVNNGKNITKENLFKRYSNLKGYLTEEVLLKKVYNLKNNENIYKLSDTIYNGEHPYEIDGLIYTPIYQGYYSRNIYKWKPVEKQTIDFLIREIESDGDYKRYNLYASCRKDERDYELFPFSKNSLYFPYLFTPSPVSKIKVKIVKKNGEEYGNYNNIPVKDNTILEFYYDKEEKDEEMRWKPYRIRLDKTKGYLDNFLEGKFEVNNGPNSCRTAFNIWDLIQNPVTEDLIFGKVYYTTNKKAELPLYKYNNMIKSYLYSKYLKKNQDLLEIAGGKGGDFWKILKSGAKYVLLFDIDKMGLLQAENRYKKIKDGFNLNLVQFDPLTENINKIRNASKVEKFDVISCQFAFHYFMQNNKTIDRIIDLIDAFLKNGGYFMFTAYDGKKVFEKLEDTLEYKIKDLTFAKIEKDYKQKEFKNYGQKIKVFVDKIGSEHQEYLINDDYVNKKFSKKGIDLVESENFGDKLSEFRSTLSEGEIEYIKLHKFNVYKKSN